MGQTPNLSLRVTRIGCNLLSPILWGYCLDEKKRKEKGTLLINIEIAQADHFKAQPFEKDGSCPTQFG
jgi:hypothetical protein